MPAEVYQVSIDGEDDGFAHLHVVVIEIDADQRLCIPAYDSSKSKVNDLCNALFKQGIYEGVGWVEIDNAKEVTFDDPSKWTGKPARWVVYKRRRIERRSLRKRVGVLSNAGLAKIVESVLNLHVERPGSTLTDEELKKVKKLAGLLGVEVPAGL